MKFSHLVNFTRICYLTVDYEVYRMCRAHFSHFSSTTEMDSSPVPVSFRTLYDFDLNEAIDVYDSIVYSILSGLTQALISRVSKLAFCHF